MQSLRCVTTSAGTDVSCNSEAHAPSWGVTETGAGGFEPPDPGIGVGPDGFIQTDNVNFAFGDRSASVPLQSTPMSVFFNLPLPADVGFTTFDSDPRVHFDTLRQRFQQILV